MNGKNILKYIAMLPLLVAIMNGCATKALRLDVTRPAEINLKNFNKIAIGDIVDRNEQKSSHSSDIADKITSALFESKKYEVLDRQHIGTLMKEHNLTVSGLVNEKTAAELGEFIGAAVLVFGRIQTDDYNEEITKGSGWTDKKGNYHQTVTREGQYKLTVHLSVVDMKTAKLLAVKDIPAVDKASTSADNKMPEKIDSDLLYTNCLNKITGNFMKMVAPYKVSVVARFLKDSNLPELDKALTQFGIDEWDNGISLLEAATQKEGLKPNIKAKAFYNLGLAQMYTGKNDEAIENFKKATSLDPKSIYSNAVVKAKKEKEIADKLKEQQ
jgi:tetratricopeptide (TPR) repeat protein